MTQRVDWPRLALAIRRKGKPLQQASKELGRHHGWLGQIARGEIADPHFHDGLELIEYARDLLGSDELRRAALGEHVVHQPTKEKTAHV